MRGVLAVVALALAASSARAGLFEDLFLFGDHEPSLSEPRPQGDGDLDMSGPRSDAGVCIAAIRQAEARHGIPKDLLMAIGLQEAGMGYRGSTTIWPWSVNVAGEGFRFDSRAEAEAFLARQRAQGQDSIDVGCLQVNLRWHPEAFPTPEAGFDPTRNADYAARFLSGLYADTGDWLAAAGRYHSATAELADGYRAGVERQLAWLGTTGAALDALAETSPAPTLPPGVWLESPVETGMNPLRAPVRDAAPDERVFRRRLLVLPAAEDLAEALPEALPAALPTALPAEEDMGWGKGSLYAPPRISDELLP